MSKPKTELRWAEAYNSASYVMFPHAEERGRVVPMLKLDGKVFRVIAHVWGPDATISEATESITLTPDEDNSASTLFQKAKAWVEERVKFLDSQG